MILISSLDLSPGDNADIVQLNAAVPASNADITALPPAFNDLATISAIDFRAIISPARSDKNFNIKITQTFVLFKNIFMLPGHNIFKASIGHVSLLSGKPYISSMPVSRLVWATPDSLTRIL